MVKWLKIQERNGLRGGGDIVDMQWDVAPDLS